MVNGKRKNKWRLPLLGFVLIALVIAGITGNKVYKMIFDPVVESQHVFFLEDTTSFDQLKTRLFQKGIIKSPIQFQWVAEIKKFDKSTLPGRYVLKSGMSHNDIINLFRLSNQTPVRLTFHNIRTREQLAGALSLTLMNDSTDFLDLFRDEAFLQKQGFTIHTGLCPFIPNTYEVYWNTSPKGIYERMMNEFQAFWNEERRAKATEMKLSPEEVIILASIVEEETQSTKEKPIVAGLYLNRLKRGIALQADPTLRFALNDFTIKRVLNEHKLIDSPYNTYKFKGLPPGPIRLPEISSVDAVLNYAHHSYIYMCAKPDFSGEHNFAKTLSEHNRNARAYRNELNRRRIYK